MISLLVAGCGRVGFDARAFGAPDAAGFSGWETPRRLDELNGPDDDFTQTLSADGLEIFFVSFRTGAFRLFRSTRASRQAIFDPPQLVMLAGSAAEPGLAATGLEMYYSPPGESMVRITRSAIGATWSVPATIMELTSWYAPDFGDDLRLILAEGSGAQVYESTRADLTSTWTPPTPISELQLPGTTSFPTIGSDGLEIMVENDRAGEIRIYDAVRPTLDAPFGPPEQLTFPELAGRSTGDPDLTPDGTILTFTVREGTTFDLYITSRARL